MINQKIKNILIVSIIILIEFPQIHAQSPIIKVYPDSVKNVVPLFGYNFTYASRGNDLIEVDTTWNSVRKQAVVGLNPGWMRFPGGTIANLYKWKNCIGSQANRTGMNGNIYSPEDNFFGPDEAGLLAEESNSEMVIVININQSAQYAADWVEYMNSPVGLNSNGGIDYAQIRANNGHPAPYNVKYWEIGNEGGNGRIWQRWDEYLDPKDNGGTGQYPHTDAQYRDWVANGGNKSFYKYKGVTNSSWQDSNIVLTGISNEKRFTKIAPVVLDSTVVSIGIDANNTTTWTRVNDFSLSSSTDLHYTFNQTLGEITFGDGINGAIPPSNEFVFTDFSIQNYDGHLQIYNAMKSVDSSIQIGSGFGSWLKNHTPLAMDASQSHGDYNAPNAYPSDLFYSNLSRALGEYSFKYNESHDPNDPPLFVTEIGTHGRDMQGAMFFLMFYAKASAWGGHIPMIGANYLLGTSQINQCHISHSSWGSIIQGTGYVTTLFNNHFGKKHVKSTTQNLPTQNIDYYKNSWDTTLYSENLEKVYTVSSINADSSTLYIMCINNSKFDTIISDIQIISNNYDYDTDSTVTFKTTSLTAVNSISSSNEIGITPKQNPIINNGLISSYSFPPASATVFEIKLKNPTTLTVKGSKLKSEVKLYPNPTNGLINIDLGKNDLKNTKISVIDILGKVLLNQKVNSKETVINLNNYPQGIYLIKFSNDLGSKLYKVIKE